MTTTWSTCTGTSKERVSILHTRTAMTTIMSIIMITSIIMTTIMSIIMTTAIITTMITDTATTITTQG